MDPGVNFLLMEEISIRTPELTGLFLPVKLIVVS